MGWCIIFMFIRCPMSVISDEKNEVSNYLNESGSLQQASKSRHATIADNVRIVVRVR
jgi:hypothetical protein